MQINKIVISFMSIFICLFLISGISMVAQAAQSIKYDFSVLFLAKTCEVTVPNSIEFVSNEGGNFVNAKDIKDKKISQLIPISLTNCSGGSGTDLQNASVYIAQGSTLTGTRDFFNNNVSGSFGVQLTDDNNKIFKLNNSTTFTPSDDSVVWGNIKSTTETKTLIANLRCQEENCSPEAGAFTATVVLSFITD